MLHCEIAEVEVLHYAPTNKIGAATIILVAPGMDGGHECTTSNDGEHRVEQLYTFLTEHGAKERQIGSFRALFAKHSVTAAKEQAIKAEKKKQQAAARAVKAEREKLRFGCKVKSDQQYSCVKCKHQWYITSFDMLKNFANAATMNAYTMNQIQEPGRCPKCGSKAVNHKKVRFWVDWRGNVVDYEE